MIEQDGAGLAGAQDLTRGSLHQMSMLVVERGAAKLAKLPRLLSGDSAERAKDVLRNVVMRGHALPARSCSRGTKPDGAKSCAPSTITSLASGAASQMACSRAERSSGLPSARARTTPSSMEIK